MGQLRFLFRTDEVLRNNAETWKLNASSELKQLKAKISVLEDKSRRVEVSAKRGESFKLPGTGRYTLSVSFFRSYSCFWMRLFQIYNHNFLWGCLKIAHILPHRGRSWMPALAA